MWCKTWQTLFPNAKNLKEISYCISRAPCIFIFYFKNIYIIILLFLKLFLKIGFYFVLDHDLKLPKSWYYRKALNKMVWCAPWLFHNLWINRALIRLIIFIDNSLEFTKNENSIDLFIIIVPYFFCLSQHMEKCMKKFQFVHSYFASSYKKLQKWFFCNWIFLKVRDMKRFSKKVISLIYSLEDDHTWAKGTRAH